MATTKNNAYFLVRDKEGEEFLCPLETVKKRDAVTDGEMNDCVEKSVVERYSGNISIEST